MPTTLREASLRLFGRSILALCITTCVLAVSAHTAAAASGSTTLRWTAPGDDSLSGRATAYDLRYSTTPITVANFALATRVPGVPAPNTPGSAESFTITGLVSGVIYYFAIKTVDEVGNWSALSNVLNSSIGTVAVRVPLAFSLSIPWPNPARGAAHWLSTLPEPGELEIDAFDTSGRHVANIAHGWMASGQRETVWNLRDDRGRKVAAGLYLIRASYGSQTLTKRLVVVG